MRPKAVRYDQYRALAITTVSKLAEAPLYCTTKLHDMYTLHFFQDLHFRRMKIIKHGTQRPLFLVDYVLFTIKKLMVVPSGRLP